MYSVIFPTMWKFEPFIEFLKELAQHELVGEIIIVDNDRTHRPEEEILQHKKIKLLDFGKNIYVNPAWNEAVKVSSFDKLCICNDDVIFDLRLFRKAYEHVTEELGVMGLSVAPWDQHITDGLIRIKVYENGDGQWGFPLCYFMHKSVWEPVPDSIKLFFGDNFIFDNCLFKSSILKVIKDLWFYTPNSITISQLPKQDLIDLNINDAIAYKNFLLSKGVKDPYKWTPSIKMIFEKFAPHLL